MNKRLSIKIKSLPQKPGAYLFRDASGRILYVGKAAHLRQRIQSHFKTPRLRSGNNTIIDQYINKVADIDFILTANAKEALLLENQLIKKYKPKYNIQWRDDKSYFWVSFTADEWPRVKIVHKPSIIATNNNAPSLRRFVGAPPPLKLRGGQGELFQPIGPFTNGRELKQVLRALRKILPYRTCKNSYEKPCLQWHLGLCPAHTSKSSINPPQPSFLKEGGAVFCKKTARVDLKIYLQSLYALRQLLRLYAGQPLRIEAYDISNIQGTNATGSMIVFKGFKPDKSAYRKFKIKNTSGANDVAMLKEVLRRRLNHAEWPLPDLILIDGGRAQLNAANLSLSTYYLSLPLIALAKRDEEIYTIYSPKVLRLNTLPSDLRLLFQAIRNEAHRFAISYYRKLHRKKIFAK
ncbi:GIY-YIG nuclease family protein [Patescibacteria group bacterium]|nr:GIY-YIG nuclease family protein [Patescibacteria group bacterium]